MNLARAAVAVCTVLLVVGAAQASTGWTWTPLDFPGGYDTCAEDVSGNTVVGTYRSGLMGMSSGFAYTNGTWTTIQYPQSVSTGVGGIDGSTVVGGYSYDYGGYGHGFVHNLQTDSWTTLDYPGASSTGCTGISGGNIIGQCFGAAGLQGFLYNASTGYKFLSYPGSTDTEPYGISGQKVVGTYVDSRHREHGFSYNIQTDAWNTLDLTSPYTRQASLEGIDGDNVVGFATFTMGGNGCAGVLYSGSTLTAGLSYPGAEETCPHGIRGNIVVGWHDTVPDTGIHGFIATLTPEPATLSLVALCGVFALRRGRR